MTREEIQHMAREAGFYVTDTCPLEPEWFHFAALVAAAEREACAKVCDVTPPYPFRPSIEAAHAIRARGAAMNRDVCEHFNPIDLPCDKCKPEALRLADALEMSSNHGMRREAADELRRLHEAHDWQYRMAGERLRRVEKLEAQRDALLEALRMLVLATKEVSVGRYNEEAHDIALSKARAAIAKAEENT